MPIVIEVLLETVKNLELVIRDFKFQYIHIYLGLITQKGLIDYESLYHFPMDNKIYTILASNGRYKRFKTNLVRLISGSETMGDLPILGDRTWGGRLFASCLIKISNRL